MPGIFEVTADDIHGLNAVQLTRLLKQLLVLEAGRNEIWCSGVHATLEVNFPDGGEDARIEWEGGVKRTEWLPCRKTIFQCKAQDMSPSDCKREIKTRDGAAIKPLVDEVLASGGAYILFCTQSSTTPLRQPKIDAFRETLKDFGKSYCDDALIDVYDADLIEVWVNQHIAAITLVKLFTGASISAQIKTWDEWSGYRNHGGQFFADEDLQRKINILRSHFLSSRNQVARIVGLSGIGKTRTALETFRPPDDPNAEPERLLLSQGCVFLDGEDCKDTALGYLSEWRRRGYSGTVIVDNCSRDLHNQLEEEVIHRSSKLSLLTLDYKIPRQRAGYIIILDKSSNEIIKCIVHEAYPDLADSDVDRIVEFAQGFPRMAVLIAQAHIDNEANIASLKDPDLVRRLVWQRETPDPDSNTVIQVCSLFHHLGWEEGASEERIHAAEKLGKIDPNHFFRLAEQFKDRGIIDQRGRYIRVVPIPLALTLASEWWRGCSPELAREVFLAEMPGEMVNSLCLQLSKLNDVPRARDVVAKLCDEQGPFSSAEVLLTKQGSRLFRSLVEVDGPPCLRVLENVIGKLSREELLEVGPARRNLVWSLEKLCFWETTFSGAAKLLLALADAENESWGNNATNQFLQLYHLYLSGTQAPPRLRLDIADFALSSGSAGKQELGVRALISGIQTGHFSRMGGVERQGSRASSEDWAPANWDDIFAYQNECVKRLSTVIATNHDDLGDIAAKGLGEGMRWLVRQGHPGRFNEFIQEVAVARRGYWPAALFSLRQAQQYDGRIHDAETKNLIDSWITLLQPTELKEKLKLVVSIPDFEHKKTVEGEHYTDVAEERALALADELSTNLNSLIPLLPGLLADEQRKAFPFGKRLAESVEDEKEFAFEVLHALASVSTDVGNPSLLCGVLAGVRNRNVVEEVLEAVNADSTLLTYLIDLTRFSRPELVDLQRILQAVKDERLPVDKLLSFSVNSVLSYMNVSDVLEFSNEICRLGLFGVGCALEILYMYTYQEPEKYRACKDTLRCILLTPGLLNEISTSNRFRGYSWEDVAIQLLGMETLDGDLAQHLSQELSGICSQLRFSLNIEQFTRKVLVRLLDDYFDYSWSAFSKALLSEEIHTYLHVTEMLKGHRVTGSQAEILSHAPLDKLLVWAEETQPEGPRVIAPCLPVLNWADNETVSWHLFAHSFIDLFGEDREFLNGISRNLHTFTWRGSIVPYFEKQKVLFEELLSHRLPQVRMWARDSIEGLEERLSKERGREAEQEFGVF